MEHGDEVVGVHADWDMGASEVEVANCVEVCSAQDTEGKGRFGTEIVEEEEYRKVVATTGLIDGSVMAMVHEVRYFQV